VSIDLSLLDIITAQPELVDYGGLLQPPSGGEIQKVERLGTRHAISIVVPPLDGLVAMQWLSRAKRAKLEGGLIGFPQPGFNPGNPGSPVVNAAVAAQATSLPIRGLSAGYLLREGQWLSVIHGGRRYLHSVNAPVTASGAGTATVTVTPRFRVALSNGDTIELATPKLEGWIIGDTFPWDIDTLRTTRLRFKMIEKS
jgi:hypothetical protein